jgi:hypothetical protein
MKTIGKDKMNGLPARFSIDDRTLIGRIGCKTDVILLTSKEEESIMKRRGAILILCLLISIPILSGGCANMTPAQKGAVGGAAVGGAAGGLIGGSRKATLIGAGAGALGGALLNDELKKDNK